MNGIKNKKLILILFLLTLLSGILIMSSVKQKEQSSAINAIRWMETSSNTVGNITTDHPTTNEHSP